MALSALPVSATSMIRSSVYSALKSPLLFSKNVSDFCLDLYHFKKNASENRLLKEELAHTRHEQFRSEELSLENARLVKLLEIKQSMPASARHAVFSRVIGRSSLAWNRVFLIDKGTKQGVRPNMLLLSESCVIGKVVEAGPSVSKAVLVTDPNSRLGVLIQRTRQGGILYGFSFGKCRVKYLSVDADVKSGDVVETAGFGGFAPKGFRVGTVEKVWKEPGQLYQVAEVKPFADLGQVEEVVCVE